jgi:hypothetical protein
MSPQIPSRPGPDTDVGIVMSHDVLCPSITVEGISRLGAKLQKYVHCLHVAAPVDSLVNECYDIQSSIWVEQSTVETGLRLGY